jgi:hypothetical protein
MLPPSLLPTSIRQHGFRVADLKGVVFARKRHITVHKATDRLRRHTRICKSFAAYEQPQPIMVRPNNFSIMLYPGLYDNGPYDK